MVEFLMRGEAVNVIESRGVLGRLGAAAAAAALVSGMTIVTTPAPAQAACYAPLSQDLSDMVPYVAPSSPVRTGASADCGIMVRTNSQAGHVVKLRCWVKNPAGNYWWSAVTEGGITGWIHEGNLILAFYGGIPGSARCPGN